MKTTVIKPKKTFSLSDFKEVWQYRELAYFFAWKDLKVRYKQTFVGVAWAVFQPFIAMVVFSVFFGGFLEVPSDGIPYPIFVYSGLLFWQFFSSALSDTSASLVGNASLITKVYFPRLILPIAGVVIKFVDFLIGAVILAGLMVYYGFIPDPIIFAVLPLLLLITFAAAIGGGLFLSAINVKYRDVRYVLPYFIQMLLFVTPVIYPASIAGKWSFLLALNPMTGVIKASRAALFGSAPINWELLFISLISVFVLLIVGIIFFKKTERYFADVV
ncbi:ABC transporter permease [Candidatus Woesearchaeota archaeon]|jgi:lipopolysaccharide transport system permease protein|nr:ABC transporter permease [Candidatus Woesearchaeota archaeon]MBT4733056.1 ABC transporter permease [Candidatus Woesearchaeota archaeon]